MKIKLLALASVLVLSGCVAPYGDIVSASEVGKVRMAAEDNANRGNLSYQPGAGLTYVTKNNQCGRNCAAYAELERKMAAEQAAAEPREDYVRAVNRQKQWEHSQRVAKWCQKQAIKKFYPEKEYMEKNYPKMHDYKSFTSHEQAKSVWNEQYKALETRWLKYENQCNEANK